ncbi:MAG: hypothetical protein ABIV51_10020 [Saprospiraceae bacterium]
MMPTAGLSDIKKKINTFSSKELVELLLKISKYKKENKEFLSYLLFDADNQDLFIEQLKSEIDTFYEELTPRTEYNTKKSLRKMIRLMNKYLKFASNKATETEIRLHFCFQWKVAKLSIRSSSSLGKIFIGQVEKVRKLIPSLHEDLQYDYGRELEGLLP